jgi:copper resistance protein C
MMFNKVPLITALLFFLLGTNVFAHSHLEDSSPKNGAVLTESLKDIQLTFETALEPTSTFTLTDSNGKDIPLNKVEIKGKQLVSMLKDNLANGTYSIHWKIIGTDGHPLAGDISFTVQLPVESTTSQQTAQTAATVSTSQAAEESNPNTEKPVVKASKIKSEQAVAASTTTPSQELSLKDYVVPVSVAVFILIGFFSYWFIFRRKHA